MDPLPDGWTKATTSLPSPWYSKLMSVRRNRFILFGAVSVLFILTIMSSSGSVAGLGTSHAYDMHNRTLGFQKVFAIGLPGRTDKRDALVLASSYSDFDIEWADGVTFEDIPEKAIPEPFSHTEVSNTAIACWRAHLNVFSKMVEEKIESALIIEDDGDWDVNVKSQLQVFAKGVTELQRDSPALSPRDSPYGNNWDMLWLGHCHSGPHDSPQKMYFVRNDSTVPPLAHRNGWWENSHILPEVLSNDTRIIYQAADGMCMWAYAMSYEGARKVLSLMSLEGGDGRQIDVTLSGWAKSGVLDKIYSIYPPLFSSHRFAGRKSRDSDIKNFDEDEMHPEYTLGIVYSAIINVPHRVAGAVDMISQWPNDTVPVRSLHESYTKQVYGELQDIDLKVLPEVSVRGVNVQGKLDWSEYQSKLSGR